MERFKTRLTMIVALAFVFALGVVTATTDHLNGCQDRLRVHVPQPASG